ncbi:MAG: HD domain-containing protein [Oscillospiraceae bacterium]|nr:HD domain-containing protein [Oscillospiraceae bacterium]
MDERLKQQLDFILEIDKEKNIFRQTTLTNHGRRENDAEHAWHMAIMIYLLKEYANKEFDLAKAMLMALIHDVVEIDAGDTYAYDETALTTQAEREAKAAVRLFGLLPEDQGNTLKSLFEEYEAGEINEAKFVRSIDYFQPLLLNDSNNGVDWAVHQSKLSAVMKRHIKTKAGSEKIFELTEKILQKNVENGNIVKD